MSLSSALHNSLRVYLALAIVFLILGASWTGDYWSNVESMGGEAPSLGQIWDSGGGLSHKLKAALVVKAPLVCIIGIVLALGLIGLSFTKYRRATLLATIGFALITVIVGLEGYDIIRELEFPGYWEESAYVQGYKARAFPAIGLSVATVIWLAIGHYIERQRALNKARATLAREMLDSRSA